MATRIDKKRSPVRRAADAPAWRRAVQFVLFDLTEKRKAAAVKARETADPIDRGRVLALQELLDEYNARLRESDPDA